MVNEALTMLGDVEKAMKDLVNGLIDIKEYIIAITPYDQFMYERAKMKPQKSNPINTLQNKKYSTWREQKWAPIWELIRIEMSETWKTNNLITIQNKQKCRQCTKPHASKQNMQCIRRNRLKRHLIRAGMTHECACYQRKRRGTSP